MIHLELTVEEELRLKEEVTKRLLELEREIARTDSSDFKAMLKGRRDTLQKLLEKLPDPEPIAA